ncbi:MAG: VOC family protein [Alphaproteobacteria bacterium]|nr:VOC family protein [Alphaproteobacteria bacterium]MDE2162970.1 VOC family protein [Alphaproteobacteria bacterium]
MATRKQRGRPPHTDILTPGEWRIVEAVRHGMSNREIAARRAISLDAVKYHLANAFAKLGLADRKALRRWDGVARGSALSAQETKMGTELQMGPLGQIARRVKDVAAARRWYGEVLGLPHLYSFGDLAFFDCGGVRLFLSQDSAAGQNESILYFKVADIRAAHAQLAARGVVFVNAPHMIHRHDDGTEEWMAFFNDEEGRPLALMAQVKA